MNCRDENKVIYFGFFVVVLRYTKEKIDELRITNYEALLIFAGYCMHGSRILLKEINKEGKIKDLKNKRTNNVNNEEQRMK